MDTTAADTNSADINTADSRSADSSAPDTAETGSAPTPLSIPPLAPRSAIVDAVVQEPEDAPWVVTVAAQPSEIVADGVATTAVTIRALGVDGSVPPDGTPVTLSSDFGTVESVSALRGGEAEAVFRAGTWPSAVALTAAVGSVTGTGGLQLRRGAPASVQLHIHGSLSEGSGTMTDQIDAAFAWGVDALWWTDHDFSYAPNPDYTLAGLDFEDGTLKTSVPIWPSDTSVTVRLKESGTTTLAAVEKEVTADAAWAGAYGLRFSGYGGDPSVQTDTSLVVEMSPRLNFRSLLADLSLSYAFRPNESTADTELWVTVPLNARKATSEDFPDSWRAIHFVHSDQDYAALSDDTQLYVDVDGTEDTWTVVSEDISARVEAAWPELRNDLHGELILLRIVATGKRAVSYDIDELSWPHAVDAVELRHRQRDFLDATPTPVHQLIGQEVSFLQEGHFNAFGETLPFFAYSDRDDWTAAEAVQIFQEAGGFVSFNHMFGVEGTVESEADRARAVEEAIIELVTNEVYGCDLLEVGYRSRYGNLRDFLTVWDAVTEADIFITAEGASDSHNASEWLEAHNNFVTWVPVEAVDEAQIQRALVRGAAWFGDPSAFPGGHVDVTLTVPEENATMGQVVIGRTAAADVVFTADSLQDGWIVQAVEDGDVITEWVVGTDGTDTFTHTVDPVGGVVVRFAVLDAEGSGLLFTNPIWFRDTTPTNLPAVRVPSP